VINCLSPTYDERTFQLDSPEDCVVYGNISITVRRTDVGSGVEQNLDNVAVAFHCSCMQRQFAIHRLVHLYQLHK